MSPNYFIGTDFICIKTISIYDTRIVFLSPLLSKKFENMQIYSDLLCNGPTRTAKNLTWSKIYNIICSEVQLLRICFTWPNGRYIIPTQYKHWNKINFAMVGRYFVKIKIGQKFGKNIKRTIHLMRICFAKEN